MLTSFLLVNSDGQTNEGVSEALAEAYTEPFCEYSILCSRLDFHSSDAFHFAAVYSPRRFPGMLEPTELSKKLASQGVYLINSVRG